LLNLSKKDAEYEAAKRAQALCDEGLRITAQRVSLIEQLKQTEVTIKELERFGDLSDEDAEYLKEMWARLRGLHKDRAELKNQISLFDPNLALMAKQEEDAKFIQPEIKDAEQQARLFRRDIHTLHGEKTELEHEREGLEKNERFMRRFLIGITCVFLLSVFVFGASAIFGGISIGIPVTVLSILATGIVALLLVFRRRYAYEVQINHKKQQKTVGMLNKKNAVFAHYANFLNFTYRKYRVRNSDMLARRLKEYDHYKHLTRRFDALRKLAEELETDLHKTLTILKLPMSVLPTYNYQKAFRLEEQRSKFYRANEHLAAIERNLEELDETQAQIWDELEDLNLEDGSVVDQMINHYMELARDIILNAVTKESPAWGGGPAIPEEHDEEEAYEEDEAQPEEDA
jgi:uncharacterized membrane protein (DUF485 family)